MTGGIARFARKQTHSPQKKSASEPSASNGMEKESKNRADSSVNLSGFDSENDFGQGQEEFGGWGGLGLSIDNNNDFPAFMDGNDTSTSGVGEFNFRDDDVGYADFGGFEAHGSAESYSLTNHTSKEEPSSGISFLKSCTSGIPKSTVSTSAGIHERNDGTSLSTSSMGLLLMATRSVKNAPMQPNQDNKNKETDDSIGRSEALNFDLNHCNVRSAGDDGKVSGEIVSPSGFNHCFPVPRTPLNRQEVNSKNSGRVDNFTGVHKYTGPSFEVQSSNSVEVTPPSITIISIDETPGSTLPGIMAKVTRSPLAGGPVLPFLSTSGPKSNRITGTSLPTTPCASGSGVKSLVTTRHFITPGIINATRDMDMPPPPSAVTPNTNTKSPYAPNRFEKIPHSEAIPLSLSDEHEQFTGADCTNRHSSNSFQDIYQDFSRSLRDFQDKEKLYSSTILDLTAQLSISHAAMLQTQGEMLDLTKELESILDSVNNSIHSIYDK